MSFYKCSRWSFSARENLLRKPIIIAQPKRNIMNPGMQNRFEIVQNSGFSAWFPWGDVCVTVTVAEPIATSAIMEPLHNIRGICLLSLLMGVQLPKKLHS